MAYTLHHYTLPFSSSLHQNTTLSLQSHQKPTRESQRFPIIHCSINQNNNITLRTCKNCKTQFDPSLNHPRACRFHTAHFGGETKRKFESVYTGGTMNTPDSGQVSQYWHCCGSEDPFDPGCTAGPHSSYDDRCRRHYYNLDRTFNTAPAPRIKGNVFRMMWVRNSQVLNQSMLCV